MEIQLGAIRKWHVVKTKRMRQSEICNRRQYSEITKDFGRFRKKAEEKGLRLERNEFLSNIQ